MQHKLLLYIALLIFVGKAAADKPMLPPHTLNDKVRLSEFVVIGSAVELTCLSVQVGKIVRTDYPECADKAGINTLLVVRVDEVLCNRTSSKFPQKIEILWPDSFETPRKIRQQAIGASKIYFLKKQIYQTDPYAMAMHDYVVMPEPLSRKAEVSEATAKFCKR